MLSSALTISLTFSQILRMCEKVTRRKPLGMRIAGAKAFAANPDESALCAHFLRGVRNAAQRPAGCRNARRARASAPPAETAEARLADLHFDRSWFGLFVLR